MRELINRGRIEAEFLPILLLFSFLFKRFREKRKTTADYLLSRIFANRFFSQPIARKLAGFFKGRKETWLGVESFLNRGNFFEVSRKIWMRRKKEERKERKGEISITLARGNFETRFYRVRGEGLSNLNFPRFSILSVGTTE